MKFIVMVNHKYLVSVEADTCGGAEHKILDNVYYGIETCQAFTLEELSTDFFRNFAENCETISISELYNKAQEYKRLQDEKEAEKDMISEYRKKIEDLQEEIMRAKINIDLCDEHIKILAHQISIIF